MSGIIGILNFDGTPVDAPLLRRMTALMAFRGPDAQENWTDGPIGFGHTMLRTTDESAGERQPCTLDGQCHIVADARIDGRKDLIRRLESHDSFRGARLASVPDVELILHAYKAWGDDCVKHLIGDFAFAIWDSRRHRLFCARDHFGIKPFYYARCCDCLVFGNTIDSIRAHPGVSDELNDLAIADFLMFGANQDPETTTFKQIQSLPPAHSFAVSIDGPDVRPRRYWQLPIDGHIRYRQQREYVEHFNAIFEEAVADRMRTDRICISMSGGLDSTSVAAMARRVANTKRPSTQFLAVTAVYDRLVPDQERHFSKIAGDALGIPIKYVVADDYELFSGCEKGASQSPQPVDVSFREFAADLNQAAMAHGRVRLTGHGGDPAFRGPKSPLQNTSVARFLVDVGRYTWTNQRLPSVGVRPIMQRCFRGRPSAVRGSIPTWLNLDFARRLQLAERYEHAIGSLRIMRIHPVRPEAWCELSAPMGAAYTSYGDPAFTRVPLEERHPLLDVRLICYLMALPATPWFLGKAILRMAMDGLLPRTIRFRKKMPLGKIAPNLSRLHAASWRSSASEYLSSAIDAYINRDMIASMERPRTAVSEGAQRAIFRAVSLEFWIRSCSVREHRKTFQPSFTLGVANESAA